MFTALYKKCLDLAAHKSSKYYLAAVSFIESSFFPIPPDVMIIPMVIAKKKEYLKIFLIASIFSVFGGIFGYLIGYLFFDFAMYVIDFYGYQDKVQNLKFSMSQGSGFLTREDFIEILQEAEKRHIKIIPQILNLPNRIIQAFFISSHTSVFPHYLTQFFMV